MVRRPARLEPRSPQLQKGMVFLCPAEPREIDHDPRSILGIRRIPAPLGPPGIGAIKDEMGYPLGMPGCILDCHRTAPAGPHHRKSPKVSCLNHTLEIPHPGLE